MKSLERAAAPSASLADRCARSHASQSGVLCDRASSLAFAAMARGGGLAGQEGRLAGRSVIFRCASQLAAGAAMIRLDGLVSRLVLCPPDLASEHLASVAATAGAQALVFEGEPPEGAPAGLDLIAFDPADLTGRTPDQPRIATQWVMFTSGTSGAPKMVGHSLEALVGAIGEPPRAGSVWGTFYDIRRYGGLQIFLRAVLGGASLILSDAEEATADFLARLGAGGVTHLSGTPSHWRRALMSGRIGAISPAVARLSGEIADQAILDALRSALPGAAIGHAFASTEAGVAFEVTDGLAGFPAHLVGQAAGEVELKVVDGSLRIRSGRIAQGYLGDGDRPLADADGFVDTGDLLERRGDRWGFLGRRGGVINVGGLKVNPEEVEAVINRHPSVRMSRARPRRNPITGAVVVADVVAAGPAADVDAPAEAVLREAILQLCRSCLPAHKRPASIRFVPALELGAGGKVARADA